jgi:2-polyprenyl-3-methyl-5-hydroxy-6-metoxy-1,4-benzoquinol methylase
MICKVCLTPEAHFKFNLTENLKVFSCKNCQVLFMEPQLSDQEITTLYSEAYYKSWGISGGSENEVSKQMKIDTFLLRLKQIRKHSPEGSVLDIGCATGFFLEAAKQSGYDPFGIELSEYSSSLAKKKFGNAAIFNGRLEECTFNPSTFDVITMFDLIEHVRVPSETLGQAATLLKPNGIIMITTPDNKSLSNRLMGKKWTHYKKEHFYYFDLESLTFIAKHNDLEIIYSENSKKALNVDYLKTQLNVYKHWLFTPLINLTHRLLPKKLTGKNFYIAIGEITVVLKKKTRIEDKK